MRLTRRAAVIGSSLSVFMGGVARAAEMFGAIRTHNGHIVTAADGGGYGGPNDGPDAVALHSDARQAGPWETFRWIWLDPEAGDFALQTQTGNYVTAVAGGGIGGPNDGRAPFHTDATWVGPDERFLINGFGDGFVSLRTRKGFYMTAVNGGGVGGRDGAPLRTDAVRIGAWERFRFLPAQVDDEKWAD